MLINLTQKKNFLIIYGWKRQNTFLSLWKIYKASLAIDSRVSKNALDVADAVLPWGEPDSLFYFFVQFLFVFVFIIFFEFWLVCCFFLTIATSFHWLANAIYVGEGQNSIPSSRSLTYWSGETQWWGYLKCTSIKGFSSL